MESTVSKRSLVLLAAMFAAGAASAQDLNGAGATFPYPIYSKWFSDYAASAKVMINYQSIGSGGGIRQFTAGTVDFGASDAPMSNDEMAKLPAPAFHFPTVLGAVVLTYNVPGYDGTLRVTGPVVADIFAGKITKWNDTRITSLNKGAKLPAADILVVHRSDGSGTSYIFTDYLSAVSPSWAAAPGKGKEVAWPVGLGGKGNEGVAGLVKQTPGSIGYVEIAYANQNKMPAAELQNADGEWVKATIESVTEAAAGAAAKLPANTDFRVSIVNAPGKKSYPISSFTWLLVYQNQTDATKGKKLVDFLKWYLHDGQKQTKALDYAPLPESVVKLLDKQVAAIKVAGM
jgi:phosphate transport system substrate-binding protein